MKSKYITFVDRESGHEVMVIFPFLMVHAMVARRLCGREQVLSAGFLNVTVDTDNETEVAVHTYGMSESLDVKSRPEDNRLAQIALGIYYA